MNVAAVASRSCLNFIKLRHSKFNAQRAVKSEMIASWRRQILLDTGEPADLLGCDILLPDNCILMT